MNDSEVLRRAKIMIEQRKTTYICYAIDDCSGGTREQKDSLTKWVMKMLEGTIFYEGWMAKTFPKVYSTMRSEDFRAGRLAWLDWMIAECEAAEAALGTIPVHQQRESRVLPRTTH